MTVVRGGLRSARPAPCAYRSSSAGSAQSASPGCIASRASGRSGCCSLLATAAGINPLVQLWQFIRDYPGCCSPPRARSCSSWWSSPRSTLSVGIADPARPGEVVANGLATADVLATAAVGARIDDLSWISGRLDQHGSSGRARRQAAALALRHRDRHEDGGCTRLPARRRAPPKGVGRLTTWHRHPAAAARMAGVP